jgi:hypothetical protein
MGIRLRRSRPIKMVVPVASFTTRVDAQAPMIDRAGLAPAGPKRSGKPSQTARVAPTPP